MVNIHFFENKTLVLSQLLNHSPVLDERIRIKGRNGTVVALYKIKESIIHADVLFEKIIKKQPKPKELLKKRR